jgi:hypothetical protein
MIRRLNSRFRILCSPRYKDEVRGWGIEGVEDGRMGEALYMCIMRNGIHPIIKKTAEGMLAEVCGEDA